MRRSGFVVRFVDVVLLLLFGFISMAQIRQTEIDLPKSSESPVLPLETEEVLYVGIRPDGTYLVEKERRTLTGAQALRTFLEQAHESLGDTAVKVRLRAGYNTPMRFMLEAAQVCDDLLLPKVLEVQLKNSNP